MLEQLPPGSTILDLGSGDGALLVAAARRGFEARGFEINPVLWLVSRVRCRRYRGQVRVRWCDYWSVPVPEVVDSVYVFTAGPYAARLARKLEAEVQGRAKPLQVISYGFPIPGREPLVRVGGLFVYRYGDE
ncbi:SAM-dependent methyltransferase [Streptomyces fructofermentans]|uniref:SAM-dependent methyltransferase n=1 Tax=Streptomyces fructofermentans TaxID=152141 RepID=UPI001676BBEF|nr:methionine biosynthesis protein MetW [Streptomyces fructofermentans]